ncbi:hypothetical protein PVL29_015590 [Vitis rotundifolia]|uniref:Uncharacterized protein n=1 Tax=Vitis rotundifolia TaxID=103349 RepID=A0AA38ZDC5_VITRO|nr:hypothetical protein PVL29_015590 [Vitis rotundifolia]
MVRFSCFHVNNHTHKSKKAVQPSVEAIYKKLQDSSQIQALTHSAKSLSLDSLSLNMHRDTEINDNAKHVTSSERCWKSEEMNGKLNSESGIEVHQTGHLKKSQSLGSRLDRVSGGIDTEDDTDRGYSCDDSHGHNGLVIPVGRKDPGIGPTNNESIFSIEDSQHLEKVENENSDTQVSGECAIGSRDHTPRNPPVMVKSCSLPNIGAHTPTSEGYSPTYLVPHSRSSEDLIVLDMGQKESVVHDVEIQVIRDGERDNNVFKTEKNICENPVEDGCDFYGYVNSAKDWIMPAVDEENMEKSIQGESSFSQWDDLPNKEFIIKRIREWVTDLQHFSPLEETNELPDSDREVNKGSSSLTAAKLDEKFTPGMEAAKRYISSLTATATTAQLANHGLVVIPFLSAFVSLKVLNLSGNAIVRITAGSLPRGLHMLNLSKNKITMIEGLRELTRLRILDLSYNRIFRIAHGLASCSSLKELYLAGNKISEVEGLHRLLKLNILDLRYNKISTAKCLGQLAANYNSLQAISLEGNPAQKNVGDEQLKKCLQGLLPYLAYYNRQTIKVSTLKDTADRSVRLGMSAHQFDRGLRSEHKSVRKGSHGVASNKPSSSATHGRKAVVSPKRSKNRHARLPPPPTGTKATAHHRPPHLDFANHFLGFKPDSSMRRSRSEGTLGAL